MPAAKASTQKQDAPTKMPEDSVVEGVLQAEDAALAIFAANFGDNGYTFAMQAQKAFEGALAFIAERDRIADGGSVIVHNSNPIPPEVEIHLWDHNGKPKYHEETGEPMMVTKKVDLHADAPNLDIEHPVNQGFWKGLVHAKMEVPPRYAKVADKYRQTIKG